MNVEPPNAQIPIKSITPYQRPVRILHRTSLPSLLVFPDDIIDCVEIETGKRSPAYTQIVNYKSSSNNPMKEKGIFVDILI